ncbi:MAG: hypothetical protein Q9181_006875 [Wetmoreana brouardii]
MLPPSRSLSLTPTFLSLLAFTSLISAATNEGSVSLWSDSSCQPGSTPSFSLPDPIRLNYTFAADTCHPLPSAAHSYIINSRPTCSNGTLAAFAYYDRDDCTISDFGDQGTNGVVDTTTIDGYDIDGQCLALVKFSSVAFLCEGVDAKGADGGPESATITVVDDGANVVQVTTSTRNAPGTTTTPPAVATTPLYPIPTTVIPGTGHAPTRTGYPSGTGTGGVVPPSPSPSPFSSAAAGSKVSILGLLAVAMVMRLSAA